MKAVAILIFDGIEDVEFTTVYDILFRANIKMRTFTNNDSLEITTRSGLKIKANDVFSNLKESDFDALVLPGGPGVQKINEETEIDSILEKFTNSSKLVAAICAAPKILAKRGYLNGILFVSHPTEVEYIKALGGNFAGEELSFVKDENFITSKNFTTTHTFSLEIVESLIGKEERIKLEESF